MKHLRRQDEACHGLRVLQAAAFLLCVGSPAAYAGRPVAGLQGPSVAVVQQQKVIKGKVVDAHGEPLIGVSVTEQGTSNGAITDMEGNFELTLRNPDAMLRFNYVGFDPQVLKPQSGMTVTMKDASTELNEVVVVGYGTQKKADLTGAVANVDVGKAIASRPITDVGKALQGITPGLTITNSTGGVGTESTIRLRGSVGSLSAGSGTAPLILVDNVEVPDLNLVNPDDIQSISVLKDAASASIYGTRAAWGVILITTKQGSANDNVRVTYSNNFAWNKPTKMPKVASASDNANFIWAIMQRLGVTQQSNIGYTLDEYSIGKIQEWEDKYGGMSQSELGEMQEGRDFELLNGKTYFYRSFDPIKEFTRNWTPQQTHNLSVTGGSKRTTYNISMSYLNQKGIMKFNTDKYDRYTLHSNITTSIRDWWQVHTNLLFTRSNNDQPYRYTSGQYDAWFYLMRWPRWYPYADYEGKPFRSAVTDIKNGNRENLASTYVRANVGTELTPLKNLTVNFDYTFGYINDAQKRNGGTVMAYNMFATAPFSNYVDIYGTTHNRTVQTSRYTLQNIFKGYATYSFNIEQRHDFKVMAGFDAETREAFAHYSERRGLISQDLPEIALAVGDQYSFNSDYSFHNDFAAAGFFGRINYDFMQKYLLEVNARYDGSSRFPKGKKWAFFPSVSAGWRASEEKFMSWAKPTLSYLKLRASWGTIGNQDVAANSFVSTMTSGNSGWIVDGAQMLSLGAPTVISSNLTWERVTTLDFGIDAGFFNDELSLTADWYHRVTSDMHTAGEALPVTFGAKVPKVNYGELTGNGFEIGLNYQHRFANGLGVQAGASFSHVIERITKFNSQDRDIYGNYEGKRLGEIWGYVTDRLFQADDFNADGTLKAGIPSQSLYETGSFKFGPGDVKYKNLDDDDKISYGSNTVEDHGDLKVIGNSLPNYEYSFNVGASYAGFDFSAFFQGVGKHDFWAFGSVAIPAGGSGYLDAAFEHQMDYWTPTHTDAFYPRPSNMAWVSNGQNYLRQTRFLCNMAYLRCKNITVGYTVPATWLKKIYLTSARVYLSAENLFEFDDMKIPVDPESTDYKAGYGSGSWSFGRSYPYSRTLSFGMQIVF
ncbi:SusC/RagA family TonB-linked outer membrane protein [Prevotella sp. kh1p2]|uniref:SusC/RagA family TonB-linked outer membrane protein n=1 Tax=Prevotella sp. kh1p2 TaxID=1761883 RepID=UPI0008AE7AFB|nr:TonB-dependent receptor [Prevotella sp. kh1p2]SET13504.1 TonB-linked outer membrane protein, SusC/RagA family [Prevotella sp. kh1p2]SNU11958.1 TonB-linked outer membrane protein, SusC/RagA family [Prevotellaceae bacterium KH2P17]